MGRASWGWLSLMFGLKVLIENMTRRLLLEIGLNVTSFVELTDQRQLTKGALQTRSLTLTLFHLTAIVLQSSQFAQIPENKLHGYFGPGIDYGSGAR